MGGNSHQSTVDCFSFHFSIGTEEKRNPLTPIAKTFLRSMLLIETVQTDRSARSYVYYITDNEDPSHTGLKQYFRKLFTNKDQEPAVHLSGDFNQRQEEALGFNGRHKSDWEEILLMLSGTET